MREIPPPIPIVCEIPGGWRWLHGFWGEPFVRCDEALLLALSDKLNCLVEFILEKKNVHNELKSMTTSTVRDFVKA
ncbi:hypothetical protein J6590_053690 [Homalodisca vitripennis]|nr:hypothetical protein J6590_053690 [Homalodisca vitripennis]